MPLPARSPIPAIVQQHAALEEFALDDGPSRDPALITALLAARLDRGLPLLRALARGVSANRAIAAHRLGPPAPGRRLFNIAAPARRQRAPLPA